MKILFIILFTLVFLNCSSQDKDSFNPKVIYQSDDLIITQVSENAFEHTSFLNTQSFGNVPCNGLIVRNDNQVIIFDTPADNKTSGELINWISQTLNCKINAIVPTHFHEDCLGGLKSFHENNISSYANHKTIELAKANNFDIPENSFNDSTILKVGNENVIIKFFGEGHTKDNVVGYFPSENILFGGCLIKELNAGKGNLADANVEEWSETVEKIKMEYPDLKIIIPGHGNYGNTELLDYTIDLFKPKNE